MPNRWIALYCLPGLAALTWTVSAALAEPVVLSHGGLRVEIETSTTRNEAEFGPRFDRTAIVTSISVDGTEFLGPWGLCDEFGLYGEGVLGYADAAIGEQFVKIGIGALVRDSADDYHFSHPYPLAMAFPVAVTATAQQLTVEQASEPGPPHQYNYRKTYVVAPENTLHIHYELTNTGETAWGFEHYNHHWFRLEGVPVGSLYRLVTGFDLPDAPTELLQAPRELRPATSLSAGEALYYASDLVAVPAAQNSFRVEIGAEAALGYAGSFSPARFALFANQDGFCPEVFHRANVQPGEAVAWSATYRFAVR